MSQSNFIFNKIVNDSVKAGASYLHLEVGSPPILRINGKLSPLADSSPVTGDFLAEAVEWLLPIESRQELNQKKSTVFVYTFEGGLRFKIEIFYQKKSLAMILNRIGLTIPTPEEIGVTAKFIKLLSKTKGLIVVAGQHGSGKTSAAASLLNFVNSQYSKYILTIEKPIEYLLVPQKSLVEQREIGRDANNFVEALEFAQNGDSDIVFVSDITGYKVLTKIFNLIATGRLVIAVIEANSAPEALEQIVDIVPAEEAAKIREILAAMFLGAVVVELLPRRGGGQIPVSEILISNTAVASLIKEGRYGQIVSIMQTSRDEGMRTLDQSLIELERTGEIVYDDAYAAANDKISFQAMASK